MEVALRVRRPKPKKPLTDSIGQRLAQLRKARGLSQIDVAEHLGVTQAFVSLYERNKTRLNNEFITQLARLLKVSADEILGLKPEKANGGPKSRRLARRLREIEDLPERQQQALLMTIDAFLDRASHARG